MSSDAIRNIATAVALALMGWVGVGVENLKISMAVVQLQIAHLERQQMKEKQNVQHSF